MLSIRVILLREKQTELNGTSVAGCKKYLLECPYAWLKNRAEMNGGEKKRDLPKAHFRVLLSLFGFM